MDIYENIVIGNFLFGLGVAMGLRHHHTPIPATSVNLLQQTPFDKPLGDVLLSNPGLVRLIEFKRVANDSSKEKSKLTTLSVALNTPSNKALQRVSRKIHWYIESTNHQYGFHTRITPYLDFLTPSNSIELSEFVESTAEESCNQAINEQEATNYKEYLKLLCGLQKRESSGSGALFIQLTAKGDLRYVALDNIHDILLSRQRVLERTRQMDLGDTRQMGRERSSERQERSGIRR